MSDVNKRESCGADIRDHMRKMQGELNRAPDLGSDQAPLKTNNNDPLITRREFCEQGKFGIKTLQRLESRGEAPAAIEITPGFVRYRQSAIDAWFAARTRTGARPVGKTPTQAIEARSRKRGGGR